MELVWFGEVIGMRSSSKRDLIFVAFVIFVGAAGAIAFEAMERFYELSRQYERWEVDEIIPLFVILSFAATWFASRRWRDANQLNQLIRDALDAAEDGFLIYDADDRLFFRNARHRELYPDFEPFMTIGRSFTEIVEAGRENGVTLFEPLDQYLEARGRLREQPGNLLKLRTSYGDRRIDNRDIATQDGYIVSTRTDVTERVKFEKGLAESEDRFRNLVEGSLQGILVHQDAKPVFVNKTWARMHGYTVEEVLELESIMDTFAPHEHERLHQYREARLRGEEAPVDFEYDGRRKDGSEIRVSNIARVIVWNGRSAVQSTSIDVTEQKAAERDLAESEERFRDLIEQSVQRIVIHRGRNPLLVNTAWARMHGYTVEEAMQLETTDFASAPHERERLSDYRERRLRGEDVPTTYEFEGLRKDGSRIWLVNSVRVVDWRGEPAIQSTCNDLTERKLAEQALQNNEARFRDFASTAADWFWEMDADLRFSYVSEHIEAVLGISADSYISKTRQDIAGQSIETEDWQKHLEDLCERRPFRDFTYLHEDPKDSVQHVSISGTPIFAEDGEFKGYRGTGRVITEQVEAAQALKQSEERFRNFADTAADWFWEMGPDLRLTYISDRVEQVFGVPVEWHIGKTRVEFTGESITEEKWQKHLQDLQERKPFRDFFFARKGPDDRIDHVMISGDPVFDDEDEFQGYRGTGRDITAQVRAQEESVRARDAARKMAVAAEEANRAKSDFLANMSHEIRTPMNAVLGLAYLLKRDNLTADQEGKVEKIRAAGTHLLGIINDILDFARIESGKLELEDTAFELDSILDHVAFVNSLRAADKDLELLYDVGTEVPRQLQGDSVRLRQVLVNLVDNAIKFSESGEVIVSVALDRLENGRAWLAFAVTDSGIGMTPEQQDRLFQPFVQADSSTTRRFGGSGLGLAICKEFAELMGGSIGVESTVGEGSTFRFTVPLRVVNTPLARLPDLSDLRVLVVDDHETSREVLTSMLRSWSIAWQAASSGEAALQAIAGAKRPFNLVIFDWHMPDLDGMEMARAIQSTSARIGPPPKVMVLTATGRENVVSAATDLEIEAVLTNPIQESALLDAVATAFSRAAVYLPETSPADIRAGLAGVRVLLAEDNEVNQEVAQQLLEDAGMVVTVTSDGAEAVATALAPGKRFDAVLMDIQMPELDGIEATELIRKRMDAKALPIIAMTAHATEHERRRCLAAGMNDHISKPVELEVLYETLSKWVSTAAPTITTETESDSGGMDPSTMVFELPSIPGLDMKVALRRNDNRPDIVQRLMGTFLRSFGDLPDTLAADMLAGKIDEIHRHAHTLRSAARTIGAESLGLAADLLERAAEDKDANTRSVAASAERFAEELTGLLDALATIEQRQSSEKKPHSAVRFDRDRVIYLIDSLGPLIGEGNTKARHLLDELERLLQDTRVLQIAREIRAHVEELEDVAAGEALSSLSRLIRDSD